MNLSPILPIILLLFVLGPSYTLGLQTQLVLNRRPIIGVLAQEEYHGNRNNETSTSTSQYIAASYIKFVEGAGAQAVPIFIMKNDSYIDDIFNKINGVLLPGGGIYFQDSDNNGGYSYVGRRLIDLAIKANANGDFFPVWGTCLGFELMMYHDSNGRDPRANCGAQNVLEKLKYTKDTMNSQLFSCAPKSIVNLLSSQPLSPNFHHLCLTPQNFTSFGISNNYSSLSINYDPDFNLTYISSVEHKKYPFYGVQFHPEKNLYEWSDKEKLPHTPEGTLVAQYFANFFVNQARKNGHKFKSLEDENRHLIYNYNPTFSGLNGSVFVQVYRFPVN